MESIRRQIGRNIISLEEGAFLLRKTRESKGWTAFWTFLLLLLTGGMLFVLLQAAQPLQWPLRSRDGWLLFFVSAVLLFIFLGVLRPFVNNWKDYQVGLRGEQVLVNGKAFAERAQTEIVVKERVGHNGIGGSYELRLKYRRKERILSFGNRLEEANELAFLVSLHLGLKTSIPMAS